MRFITTLLVAAGMTLAAFAQTPSTVGVALQPRTSRVVGSGTNLFTANADRAVATLSTVARLATITNAVHGSAVDVRGYDAEQDLPYPMRFTLNTNSVATTNRFTIANAGGDGRWVHDWDGDVRAFGAKPYEPKHTLVPWGYKATNSAIGTGPFSIWIRTTFPAAYRQPVGMFEVGPLPGTNISSTPELLSSIGMRAFGTTTWGFVFRGIDGSSGVGTNSDGAAVLESSAAALSAYAGQVVDLVVTRSGTNAAVFMNGTDVTSLFTFSNPAGWGKSLGLGQQLLVQAGNSGNTWYWPKPIQRFAMWGTALNLVQSADPGSVGSKLVDFTPSAENLAEPTDSTAAFNAASDYVKSQNGGVIYMPPGVYRIDGEVRVGQNVHWKGAGSSPYPLTFRQAARLGSTVIVPWFGATNRVFVGDQSQSGEVCITSRALGALGGGYLTTRWLRAKLSDFVIAGGLSYSSSGMVFDRVGAIEVRGVNMQSMPGNPARFIASNSIQFIGNDSGAMGRGVEFLGCADFVVDQCFFDGAKGPVLRYSANLARVANSVFEIATNPRTSVPVYEAPTTADTSTDVFTWAAASGIGHRFALGDIVRFSGDTLPSPLTSTNDYYVYPLSDTTYKVSTQYVDEISQTGTMFGNNFVDVTTSVTNTWYSGSGPAVGMLVNGDHNTFANNQSQRNYAGGLIIEGAGGNNMFIGNQWITSGEGNTDTNNVAAVRIIHGSNWNSFLANSIDDRENSGFSQNGFLLSDGADYNTFIGNTWNIDYPYIFGDPAKQLVIDAKQSVYQWNGASGNLYIPARTSWAPWDVQDWVSASAMELDKSSGRLFLSTGTNNVSSDFNYAISYPAEGPAFWSGNSGGISAVNNGTGATLLNLNSRYGDNLLYSQINSTNSSQGFRDMTLRNRADSSSTYGALLSGDQIRQYSWGGWYGANVGNVVIGASMDVTAAYNWSAATNSAGQLTNVAGRINFRVVPQGTNANTVALSVVAPLTPATNLSYIVVPFNGVDLKLALTNESGVLRAIFLP